MTDYYSVQVKSNDDPWLFESGDEIRWLIDYPTPLFLACVDKHGGILRIYQTMPRFVANFWPAQTRLELVPTLDEIGQCAQWQDGKSYSLSAPILRVSLSDLLDEEKLNALREVLEYWIRLDEYNCDLRRSGILRFRMPPSYKPNEVPSGGGIVEQGISIPTDEQLASAVRTLFEVVDCVGYQLEAKGDRTTALLAALLLRHLGITRTADFAADPRWSLGVVPPLLMKVALRLLAALQEAGDRSNHLFGGLEDILRHMHEMRLVATYLNKTSQTG